MNLLKSTGTFSFYTVISRLLGYLRDILIAIFLGTGMLADAFFVAFRIPNTFRRLFAEGTFNAAFVPSYSSEIIKGKKQSSKFANNIFNLLFLGLLFLTIIVEIFMPVFVSIIAPGFVGDFEKMEVAINLTRITFPFLFFICLASFFSAILNSHNKFAAAAAAPIILNIVLIASLFISFFYELNIAKNLSIGVTLAGVFQFIILIFFTRKFYLPSIKFVKKFNNNIKLFFRKLLPSIFSSGITQINILIGTIIASFQSGAVSYLYYADRIYQINLAIAGIAIGTVALPNLARSIKLKKQNLVDKLQIKSIELCLLLSIPAALGLLIASEQIVNSLFGYGSFSKEDIYFTSLALIYFSIGVPAFALIKVLSNFYFARNNTKLPFYISFITMLINIIISLSLFKKYGFIIIPIATSLSTWLAVVIYLVYLKKNKILFLNNVFNSNFLKILFSTFLMSVFLYYGLNNFEDKFEYANKFKLIYLLIMIGLSSALYLMFTKIFGILNLKSYKIK